MCVAFRYVQFKVIVEDLSQNLYLIVDTWGEKLKKDVKKSSHESCVLIKLLNI